MAPTGMSIPSSSLPAALASLLVEVSSGAAGRTSVSSLAICSMIGYGSADATRTGPNITVHRLGVHIFRHVYNPCCARVGRPGILASLRRLVQPQASARTEQPSLRGDKVAPSYSTVHPGLLVRIGGAPDVQPIGAPESSCMYTSLGRHSHW
jgi:hypothetical protein